MIPFISSKQFIVGAFLSFLATMTVFTFIIVYLYTPNNLLEHSGFYKDGKMYRVIETSQLREKCDGI